eukprot:g2371.t1
MPASKKRSSSTDLSKESTKRQCKMDGFVHDGSFRIVTWNVNGLRAICSKEEDPLRNFIKKHKPDVVCICETKLQEEDLKSSGLENLFGDDYSEYYNFAERKGYSGTAVFVKNATNAKETYNVSYGIGIPKHDKEGRVITVEFEKFYLVNSYVPNSGLKLERLSYRTKEFDPAFRSYLQNLEKSGKPVIWTGDLNVGHADSDVADPKKKRNKTPGFCDQERLNFGTIVGGAGLMTEEAKKKRTALLGRPGPLPSDSETECLRWTDAWWKLHQDENAPPDAEAERKRAEGYSFWSYRFKAFEKNRGWRLDYFVLSPTIAKQLLNCCRWKDLRALKGSDHIPIGLEISME